jgi:hypothetical protein
MLTIQTDSSPLGWRGRNELRRLSRVYSAKPVLRLFGKTIPLGESYVVIEVIQEMPGPTLCTASRSD